VSDVVIVALIAAGASIISATVAAVALYMNMRTHDLINSRMTEMLALVREAGVKQGIREGIIQGHAERDEAAR